MVRFFQLLLKNDDALVLVSGIQLYIQNVCTYRYMCIYATICSRMCHSMYACVCVCVRMYRAYICVCVCDY